MPTETLTVTCPGCDGEMLTMSKTGTEAEIASWRARNNLRASCTPCRSEVAVTGDERTPMSHANVSRPVVDEVEVLADGSAIVRGAWLDDALVRLDGLVHNGAKFDGEVLTLPPGAIAGERVLVEVMGRETGSRGPESSAHVQLPNDDYGDEALVVSARAFGSTPLRVRVSDGSELEAGALHVERAAVEAARAAKAVT